MVWLGWVGLGWVGLGWVGLGWVGLGWVGLGWVGLGLVGLGLVGLGLVGFSWVDDSYEYPPASYEFLARGAVSAYIFFSNHLFRCLLSSSFFISRQWPGVSSRLCGR